MNVKESELYPPLKRFLESRNYEVKGEVCHCDILGVRAGEAPVVVELKRSLNLDVILQAVDRLALTPNVYVGVPCGCRALKNRRKPMLKLFRMLGLGLLVIDPDRHIASVEILLDPGSYQPRISKRRQTRLLAEFATRKGDPNRGGSTTRHGIVTAYRQRAIAIGKFLQDNGKTKASAIAQSLQEPKARNILYRNVYGWFERVSLGIYQLSPRGTQEVPQWLETLDP
ncbi:MAG: DUF2161 family putative PD-(D/E)XK-type phosphodiesterase [Cyanobacteria bacterium J06639_1]